MASSITEDYKDFFNFTKVCSFCKKGQKTFKVLLSCYNKSGRCILSEDEKKKIFFICTKCHLFNELDFDQMANEYVVTFLQNKILLSTQRLSNKIEKEKLQAELEKVSLMEKIIKLKLQEYE